MKVAAYQAPLLAGGSMEVVRLVAEQVKACEAAGVTILCCPEAVLGGLADYSGRPADLAIDVASGQLRAVLGPCTSPRVTTIVGFTEAGPEGQLFNSAAVFSHVENGVAVIRADVAGRLDGLGSFGSSGIVEHDGTILRAAGQLEPDLLIAEIRIAAIRA